MNANMLKVPYFAKASSYEVLQKALQEGGVLENLDRIAYILTTDTNKLYHVSLDKIIRPISGDKEYVKTSDELPSIEEGKSDVIYIVKGVGYQFDGEDYIPIFDKHQVDVLQAAVTEDSVALHTQLDKLANDLTDLTEIVSNFDSRIQSVEETASEVTSDFNDLSSFVNNRITSINNTLNDHESRITASSSSIQTITGQLNDAQTDISDLQLNMGAAQAEITSHTNALTNVYDRLDNQDDTLDSFQSQLDSSTAEIASIQQSVTDMQSNLDMEFI